MAAPATWWMKIDSELLNSINLEAQPLPPHSPDKKNRCTRGTAVLYKSCFRAQKPLETPLLGCPIHFSELLKHLIDAEARRTLSWWIVAE